MRTVRRRLAALTAATVVGLVAAVALTAAPATPEARDRPPERAYSVEPPMGEHAGHAEVP